MKILQTQNINGWRFAKFHLGNFAKALTVASNIHSLPDNSKHRLANYWWDADEFLRIVRNNAECRADRGDYASFLQLRRVFNSIQFEKN